MTQFVIMLVSLPVSNCLQRVNEIHRPILMSLICRIELQFDIFELCMHGQVDEMLSVWIYEILGYKSSIILN